MKLLAIESSSLVAAVAVYLDGVIAAEYSVNFKKTHSQTLLPMLDTVAQMLELDLHELDAIAVSGGPGSFTGLRIGSATAKGLGLALDKPLIHVPTLDAMAYNLYGTSALICPMLDARRNQVYTGLYRFEREFETVLGGCCITADDLAAKLNERGERVVFLGDGVPAVQTRLETLLTVPHDYAPAHVNRQRAAGVAALGAVYFAQDRTETAAEHVPDYFRKAQAERALEEAVLEGRVQEMAAGHILKEVRA